MNGTIISTSTLYTQLQRNQRKTHIEHNHNNIIPCCITHTLLCTVVGRFHHFSSSVDVFRSLSHQIACDILWLCNFMIPSYYKLQFHLSHAEMYSHVWSIYCCLSPSSSSSLLLYFDDEKENSHKFIVWICCVANEIQSENSLFPETFNIEIHFEACDMRFRWFDYSFIHLFIYIVTMRSGVGVFAHQRWSDHTTESFESFQFWFCFFPYGTPFLFGFANFIPNHSTWNSIEKIEENTGWWHPLNHRDP